METVFHNKRIDGLISIVPEREILFEEEISNYAFPEKQTLKLKKLMGYDRHRIVKESTASSDLCIAGLQYLFDKQFISKEEVGGLIVVTSTPDYLLPGTSSVIHNHFGLSTDVACFDLMQGCTGFIQGLTQGFMLLDHLKDKKVVLCNVDVLSKKTSKQDRNSFPLIGDAASVAILSNAEGVDDVYLNYHFDGSRYQTLIIPAGGSRLACSAETAEMKDVEGDGNLRCLDNLKMNGTEVFQFVQADVPPMITETLAFAGITTEDVDWYLFHQPNRFMLKKLAEKLEVPYEKVPMNVVENFGNSSGVCVPLNITFNLGEKLLDNKFKCCLSAFGSGLSWGAIVMTLGNFNFCEMLKVDC